MRQATTWETVALAATASYLDMMLASWDRLVAAVAEELPARAHPMDSCSTEHYKARAQQAVGQAYLRIAAPYILLRAELNGGRL